MANVGIVVIAYNRIDSLARVLKSLAMADYEDFSPVLFISIDKSDSTEVVEFAKKYEWPYGEKRTIEHPQNLGLRKHVLSCGNLLDEFDGLIVLEDDTTVAPSFYSYAVRAVDYYKDDGAVAGISLYSFLRNYQTGQPFLPLHDISSDVYMMNCAQSWGQVWMKKQWKDFISWYAEHDEEFPVMGHLPEAICRWPKSSWLKYHTRYCIEEDKYFVYPYVALSTNNSDAGTHCGKKNSAFQVPLPTGRNHDFRFSAIEKSVCYDGFFNCKNIARYLNMTDDDVCIDFYGTKKNVGKRYLLSPRRLDYKIEREWSLSLRPYEQNIIMDNVGSGLFLYDTIKAEKNRSLSGGFVEYLWPSIDINNSIRSLSNKDFLKCVLRKIKSITKTMIRQ